MLLPVHTVHPYPVTDFCTRAGSPFHQIGIEGITHHHEDERLPGPAENRPTELVGEDQLVHGSADHRLQVKPEAAHHPCLQAATTGLVAGEPFLLQKEDAHASRGQLVREHGTRWSGAHDRHWERFGKVAHASDGPRCQYKEASG
ncbi:MAG: hypothetical protein KatS3mg061_3313 [Dehalococcoidia bacterium]|nr:MAG: hypothetical protein KatS3mg061_3313 [Dehalococcoidia bacterium]